MGTILAAAAALAGAGCSDETVDGQNTEADAGGGGGADAGPTGTVLKRPSKSSTIAISDNDKIVGMVNPEDGTVSFFQTSDNTRTAKVPTGGEPSSIVIAPDGKTAYVSNRADATVVKITAIDTASPQVSAPLATGSEPTGVALSPTGATLFVADFAEGEILVIDTASMTVRGSPIKGAIEHVRALAVTNDGDGDDGDELLIAPEFYGTPNENALDATTLDRSRTGRVRIYDLSQNPPAPTNAVQFAARDTGIVPAGASASVFASPNQLWAVAVRRDVASPGDTSKMRIYVPTVSAAPQGPPKFNGNVFPIVYVGDLGARAEITNAGGTVNLAEKILAANGPAPAGATGDMTGKLFLDQIVDLSFVPRVNDQGLPTDNTVAYVVSRGADAVQRVDFADGGVSVGGVKLQIPIAGGANVYESCKGPNGIVVANNGGRAYVNCWVSKRMAVIELGNSQSLVTTVESSTSATLSADRGRRFYFTGLGRWSGNGDDNNPPTLNGLGWESCGSCHPDGLSDNITWIFGSGPRQTTSMDGSFSHGPGTQKQRIFNWTGINDEIHDFERNTRGTSGGLGAITTGTACGTLGMETRQALGGQVGPPVKDLQNTANNCQHDWDDIEAWVRTIRPPRGLKRLDPTKVAAGAALFASGSSFDKGNCGNCHGGAGWTVSRVFYTPSVMNGTDLPNIGFDAGSPWPVDWSGHNKQIQNEQPGNLGPPHVVCGLRNLGTQTLASTFGPAALEKKPDGSTAQGQGGYNVPSLYGLSLGAPYLHSGQAKTLKELFDNFEGHLKAGNQNFAANAQQKEALIEYLLSIDASTPEVSPDANFDKCKDFP